MRFEPRNGQDSKGRWNPDSWMTRFNCFEITVACYESLLQSALCAGKFHSTKKFTKIARRFFLVASGIEVEVNKGKLRSSMTLGSKQLEAIWTEGITDVAYSYSELDTGGQGYVGLCCHVRTCAQYAVSVREILSK